MSSARPSITLNSTQRGIVLPTVLWVTILTIVIASNYASDILVNTNAVDNIRTATLLRHDATSGIYLGLQRILGSSSSEPINFDAQINNSQVEINVRLEGAKINVNSADSSQLSDTLRNSGLDAIAANQLAGRIIDWRDGDQSRSLNGMEDQDYLAMGKEYGAKDSRIEDLAELMLLMDMDVETFNRLSQRLTVYDRRAGRLVTISANATDLAEGQTYMISAIIQLTNQAGRPYRVLKWFNNQS